MPLVAALLAGLVLAVDPGIAPLVAQAPAPGELWLVSGEDRRVLRLHRGLSAGDEFGAAVAFDVLPLPTGAAAAALVGAPGTAFPGGTESSGRLVAVDDVTDEALLRVDAADLPGAPVARLGHSLVDLGHVGADTSVHWAVGAPGSPERGGPRPAVVLLHAAGAGLVQRDRVTRRRGSLFGWALASLGLDRDGGSFLEGVAAGAPTWRRGRRQHVGAVEGIENETARRLWRRLGEEEHAHFGHAVAPVFDRDGDGWDEVLVGAPGTRDRDPAGRVYLLSAEDGRVLQRFEAPRGAALFGFAVGAVADVDGDGAGDFVVGAPATDVGGRAEAGAVFVLSGADGRPLLRLDGEIEEGWFGAELGRGIDPEDGAAGGLVVVSLLRSDRPRPRHQRGLASAFSLPEGEGLWTLLGAAAGDRMGARIFKPFLDADGDDVFDYAVSVTRGTPVFLPE